MTRTAYNRVIQEDGRELPPLQELSWRLWDVCFMFVLAAGRTNGPQLHFEVYVVNWSDTPDAADPARRIKEELITLKAICGPGDDANPVITMMLPDED